MAFSEKLLKNVAEKLINAKANSIEKINEGFANDVYEVKTDKGDFILRAIPKDRQETYQKTKIIMEFLKGEIPNKLIKLSEDKKIFISDKIKGDSLQSQLGNLTDDEIVSILKDAFKLSKRMSNKKISKGFGHLNEKMEGWAKTSIEEVFHDLGTSLSLIVSKNYLDAKTAKKISNLFYDNIKLFLNVEPRFVYCDLNFGNIIIENKKFKSLIDFDFCVSGDPIRMFAIVFLTKHSDKRINDILIKAMGLNAGEKARLRLYSMLFILTTLRKYCEEYLGKSISHKLYNEKYMKHDRKFLIKLLNNKIKM